MTYKRQSPVHETELHSATLLGSSIRPVSTVVQTQLLCRTLKLLV